MFTLIHMAILAALALGAFVAYKLHAIHKAVTVASVVAGVKSDVATAVADVKATAGTLKS